MSVQEASKKAFVSVVEMAELVGLSKSRFHALVRAGVFPKPVVHSPCKRPGFDLELQGQCVEIRQTGIGLNGQPVLFNRMRTPRKPRKQKVMQPIPENRDAPDHADIIEAMKSLGLSATTETIGEAVAELYPAGLDRIDKGELIRQVFRHLRLAEK